MTPSKLLPETPGFYVHYKHDPNGDPYNYMYEVTGIARNTETKDYLVLYRPLYSNDWFPPANYQARPLEMFMEEVEKEGLATPRFQKITDPDLISQLEEQKREIYG